VQELVELRARLGTAGTAGTAVRIAADESVRRADDPLAVARAGAADLLVLKAQPLGGIERALEIVSAADLPVIVSSALDTSAGIAMGLVSDEVNGETRYVALTDILGAEDAFGDMDFKVAGTKEFVTALQLDTKLDGIPSSVLAGALAQAKDARLVILDVMAEAIDAPDEMSPYAPRVTAIKVPIDKIGEVIGPKGKMINSITEQTGASISIEDDGTVFVGATDGASAQAAIDMINAIANPQLPKIGERFLGTVVKTTDFGAFVSLLPGRDGLVHISKLGRGKRVSKVEDVVKLGDKLRVEIADIDNRGKISLVPVDEDNAAESAPAPADAATANS
jgi:polyribonucleotide nucleotidyltransferase